MVKGLRDQLDGPRLSDEERAIDIIAIIVEKETLRIEVGGLRNFLVEANVKGATAAEQIASFQGEIAQCHAQIRRKDQMITHLERCITRSQPEGPKSGRKILVES